MQTGTQNSAAILRLTALWALAESGLGGWMHALHLPLTGIFVGGAAVVFIALIAHYSRFSYRQVLQATLLVMLVKFAASPQSPPQAYVAVGFQGVAGAVLYRLIPHFTVASVLFAAIAMLESALQKLIFMTLLYGRSLWEALDKFVAAIAEDFSLPAGFSFSYWLIAGYTGLYLLWGLVLGVWISSLPRKLESRAASIRDEFHKMQSNDYQPIKTNYRKQKSNKWLWVVLVLLFIAGVFLLQGNMGKAGYVVLRTIAALLLIFGIINPIVKKLMQNWLNRSRSVHKERLQSVMDLQQELRSIVRPAYRLAAGRYKGIRRYPEFLFILIVVTLHPLHESTQDLHILPVRT